MQIIKSKAVALFDKLKEKLTARDAAGNIKLFDTLPTLIGLSFLLEFVIEILSRHSLIDAFVFLIQAPYAFAFSALIIFATLSISLLTPCKVFLQALFSVIWLGLGVANCVLLAKRVTPFSVNDLELIPSVFRIFRVYLNPFEIALIVIGVLAVLAGLVWLAIKAPRSKIYWKKAIISVVSSLLLLFAGFEIGLTTGVLESTFPNLADAYLDYGFPYCYIVGIFDRGIREPDDYSENRIAALLDKIGADSESDPERQPNVIYLQLESFFDVNYHTNVEFSENPVPYFTQLKSEAVSGFLTVPSIGAGTVNTEFEVLTGMDLGYFGAGEYPYKTVLRDYTCESAAYNLKEMGYATHAIHNYEGTFYNRYLVYQNLGFDSFTSIEYMEDVEYNVSGIWPKDEILIDEILSTLDSTAEKDFVMAVSVQGHGKYPPGTLPEDYVNEITASFIDGTIEGGLSDIAALTYYVNQLREMDEFIRQLVEKVRNYPEDTILVMYGDHLPSLSIASSDLINENIFQTEYVIVSNMGLEEQYESPGDLYAYQLGAIAFDMAGIHRGVLTKFHQKMMGSADYRLGLQELQYDMLYGERYVYGGNKAYYPSMIDMTMGITPITVTGASPDDGYLYIDGAHFTLWSKIEIDGKLYADETEYLDSTRLRIRIDDLPVNSLRVVQYSEDGVILSSTEEFYRTLVVPEA